MSPRSSCRSCGAPISQTPGPGRPRVYCSSACRARRYVADRHYLDANEIIERWGSVCYLCNEPVDRNAPFGPDMLNIDHVVPVSRGGASNIENLRIVHYACNIRKGGGLPCPHCASVVPSAT